MTIPTFLARSLARLLPVLTLCFVNVIVMATEFTETFDAAGFSNHQDFSIAEKITVGPFEYKVQTNGSLKTVIDPAAISIGFNRDSPVTRFTISHISSEVFAFRGFTASNQFEMSENATVSGYLNGSLVTVATSVVIPWPVSTLDFSAIPEFSNVDEVRIESSDLYFILEDIQYTSKEAQTITFADPADIEFIQEGAFQALATSTSGLTVIITSLTPSVCDVTGQTVSMISTGLCELAASQPGDANFLPATNISQTVELQKSNQTTNFIAPIYKSATDAPFAISATTSSGLGVIFATTTPSICSVSVNSITLITPGVCTISANQSGDASYNAAAEVMADITVIGFGSAVVKVAEIAKPILQYMNGLNYGPTAATGVYADVQNGSFNAAWLEKLAVDMVLEGCADNKLCPQMPVTKEQLARILLKAKLGGTYTTPQIAFGFLFDDVLENDFSANWIEDLSNKEISSGCAVNRFCPKELVTVGTFIGLLNNTFPR